MDGSVILTVGLVAVMAAMILTLYEMGSALRPATCAECSHCQALAAAKAREQEQLSKDYARRVGLGDDDEDDRRIG
jgi:hypothetical protein